MRLVDTVHQTLAEVLRPGDIAIDATLGNGHDTLFLASRVGPAGQVYGFDIQAAAISASLVRLQAAGLDALLIQAGHETMVSHLPPALHGKVRAVVFNLGYLPGSDKGLITRVDTTRVALQTATSLLAEDGVISVLSYTGHRGGQEEFTAVHDWFLGLSDEDWNKRSSDMTAAGQGAPVWFFVRRRRGLR